jgi:signal recognition particle subunit SRP54
MASRILGMGDVLSLIEKAESAFDAAQAEKMEKRLREQKFDLEDFLEQFAQLKKMGSVADMLKMIPGIGKMGAKVGDIISPSRQPGGSSETGTLTRTDSSSREINTATGPSIRSRVIFMDGHLQISGR